MKRTTEAERMELRVRDAISALEALLAPSPVRGRGTVLADLIARGEMSSEIDGYPRGTSGERTSGGEGGDPTASAFLARGADVCGKCKNGAYTLQDGRVVTCRFCGGSGRRWADPVGDAIVAVRGLILAVSHQTRSIDKHRVMVLKVAPPPGRQSSLQGTCIVCERWVPGTPQDRLKRGMDNACYLAWGTWKVKHGESGDPGHDFHQFTRERRAKLEKAQQEAEQQR